MARRGTRLEIESDCTEAIRCMQQAELSPWRVRNLARECAELANGVGEVWLSHMGREANSVADWAAARASVASGYCQEAECQLVEDWPELPTISTEDAQLLTVFVTNEEIKLALRNMLRGEMSRPNVLHSTLNAKVRGGELFGVTAGDVQLSHLLYAYDLLIMAQVNMENVRCVLNCLRRYSDLTNQRVNLSKSELYLLTWICSSLADRLAEGLGLRKANLPVTYLNIRISGGRLKAYEHNELIERMEKKLAEWKKGLHSMANILTLVNSTLMAIPTYWLGSMWVQDAVLDKIERIARAFLWGSRGGGLHLIGWEAARKSKEEGLVVQRLKLVRAAS
ncbi:uncharacterized protein [Typha angustifolia]|uniref:uncharacterized protein n=1 Tax=Typha angustifolia TaxID=59011 RepID=UPI003C2FFFAD